jgi:DNA-binding MarR family transcriptional regulator
MKKDLDLSAMDNCVCFNMRSVARAFTQFYDGQMRRYGIRPTQTPVLGALAGKSGWSMEELSNWLGMDRTTLVRNLRPLEREGLVEMTGTGRGGRVSLSITPKGRMELENVMPAWRSAQQAAVETLGEQRWSAILLELNQAARALNS